jgi:hypothetical protein
LFAIQAVRTCPKRRNPAVSLTWGGDALIGYTEHPTDLAGGRQANVKTRRAATAT